MVARAASVTRRRPVAALFALIALIGTLGGYFATTARAGAGDFKLDFASAASNTYDHLTGVGGSWDPGPIVQQLEGGDFACGDKIIHFVQVTTDAGATGTQSIEIDYSLATVTTSNDLVGYRSYDSLEIDPDDDGNIGLDTNENVSFVGTPEAFDPLETDPLNATIQLDGLDAGDVVIVRLVTTLGCLPDNSVEGNVHAAIDAARVAGTDDAISAGQDTTPLKQAGLVVQPGYTLEKTADAGTVNRGDPIGYAITLTNTGNVPLTNVTITDDLQPEGLTWTDDSGACEVTDGTLTCTYASIEPVDANVAGSGIRTVNVDAVTSKTTVCGQAVNTAHAVTANAGEKDASATVVITCPTVTITKTGNGTINAGAQASYTITVTNTGNGIANEVQITDELPDGLAWTDNKAECDIDVDNNLTCNVPPLAPAGQAGNSFSVTVTATTSAANCDGLNNTAFFTSGNNGAGNASATITVQCPDIEVSKVAHHDGAVSAGTGIGFTITVVNNGPGVANDVELDDELPTGPSTLNWVLGGTAAGDCGAIVDNKLHCEFGDLGVGAANGKTVTVTSVTDKDDCELISNRAEVTATNEPESALANNESTATQDILCGHIDVDKAPDDGNVTAGGDLTFTIKVKNLGPGETTGSTVTDELPEGFDWDVSVEDPEAVCGIEGGVLTCEFGTLAAGAERTITLTAPTTGDDCGPVDNSARAFTNNDGEDTDPGRVTVRCPDVTVVKTASDESVSAGTGISFTLVVRNDGDGNATNVDVDDQLPAGFDWEIDPPVAGCTINDSDLLHCDFDTLAPGAANQKVITVVTPTTAANCGPVENAATVDANNEPSNGGESPNSDEAAMAVLCPDIEVVKTAVDDEVTAPGSIGFTIELTNNGQGTANAVTLHDELPAGYDWSVSAEDPEHLAACSLEGNVLTCPFGPLGPGDSRSVSVTAEVNNAEQCGEVVNTATVAVGNEANSTLGDNDSTADVTVICPPVTVNIDKTGPALAHVGDEVTYTMVVTNTGDTDLATVTVTDPRCDEGTLARTEGDDVLSPDESWTYGCTHVVTADDDDPLPNTATVAATDVLGRNVGDDDPHEVDLIHPAITIDKAASPVNITDSGEVTYTYVVENTGDATLTDIKVTDDVLGEIGTIDELEAGASETLEKTVTVNTSSETHNVGTATGVDPLGKEVSDTDDADINVVLGAEIVAPAPPPLLPRTGTDPRAVTAYGVFAILLGFGALRMRKRLTAR